MTSSLFGYLTILTIALELVFAACAFVFIRRLERRPDAPVGEIVGAHRSVLAKLRKGDPLSPGEADYAAQMVSDCRSLLAYSIPAAIFTMGCFYIFGCLEQLHGGRPSIRTFIGVLPMFGSTNMTIQLRRVARMKGRLPPSRSAAQPPTRDVMA